MPVDTTTGIPCQFAAGTTVRFTMQFDQYPAGDWTLAVSLLGAGAFSENADLSGDGFLVVFSAAQTANLTPGQYRWAAIVTEAASGDVAVADSGFVTITPNIANSTPGPWRTRFNTAAAAFSDIAASKYSQVEVEGQSFTKSDGAKMQQMLDYLEDKAITEDKVLGRSASGTLKRIQMRF